MDCTIRSMRSDEVEAAIGFAAREGWNPGLHDAACFHAADPGGFLLAEQGGQMLGCISAVSYGGSFGFIGLYIVAPAWRGQGIGRCLWTAAMARLAGQVIGLDGVPAQQDNYRRSGFELAWRNARFAGLARPATEPAATALVPLGEVDFDSLCDSDRWVFPAARPAFLRRWIEMPDATGLAWCEHGHVAGWGVIRRCRDGHKIAPLVAERAQVADALYAALCSAVPEGDTIYLDVPLPNADALALAADHDMRIVFETARMYVGPAPACDLQQVYGITSFELG